MSDRERIVIFALFIITLLCIIFNLVSYTSDLRNQIQNQDRVIESQRITIALYEERDSAYTQKFHIAGTEFEYIYVVSLNYKFSSVDEANQFLFALGE